MAKENMFAKMTSEREEQQKTLEAKLSGEPVQTEREKILQGRPRKRQNATTMTISLSQEDKEKIKLYAFSKSLTVSDLIHQWIEQNCIES